MKLTTTADRRPVISLTPPSTPRLRMESTGSRRTLLDGAWWPRSTDPVAELPGLILAIDKLRGPVTRLVLAAAGWDSHPRRLGVNGRVLRLGYFTSQPVSLLTAICGTNERIDLLVVPPRTATGTADAAMVLAAATTNKVHAQHILLAVSTPTPRPVDAAEEEWETEGGQIGPVLAPAGHRAPAGQSAGRGEA
ncbi:DUF5994 family protein [Phytohabitans rumicis]|uniref:Uncharacterized protein n=1 Tax=Phytohabitans rumicis TaxID=1076125 RepID=A0A6V8LTF7_9ACTN|nr:DUF5994 family protein [Phytohabitans rumicis]GFJ96035.1 hypothetical protein Prum_096770 [Phytohabitans rumicis]